MLRFLFLTLFFFITGVSYISGQLSDGGTPRMLGPLKKTSGNPYTLPAVSNDLLRWEAEQLSRPRELKSLVFAHTFEVDILPANDGSWQQLDDGWWIWQLEVVSKDAYSLNLIFEDFFPARGDRLFLFTPGHSQILGSFGYNNRTESGVFPVSPLSGDHVIVQYETRMAPNGSNPFRITQVNHDFLGIFSKAARRPLGKSGTCHPDINCEVASPWREVQNSVCRILIGKELCTGTLLNNTAQNMKPYVITANHCIPTNAKANSSIFLFNYESPYCGSLDGDITNSLSGSQLKATLDSLDFSLVEISTPPPAHFRPFYAGWNRSASVQDTVASIHHPLGDIKKIAVDHEIPVVTNFYNIPLYTVNGFWKINRWEVGATEAGSSGGPLFNAKKQLMGTLVGGEAKCGSPFNDYYSRFNLGWDKNQDSARQLRYWLDPLKSNPLSMEGKQFYWGQDLCMAFTNLEKGDSHQLTRITDPSGTRKGFWTGTNTRGITEVAEKFSIPGDEKLYGISIGVGRKFAVAPPSANSSLRVNIYNLYDQQKQIIHSQTVPLASLVQDAMNLIVFNGDVQPLDSFLVAFDFQNIAGNDSLAIYHSYHVDTTKNTILVKMEGQWTSLPSANGNNKGGALALELIACNVAGPVTDSTNIENPLEVTLFPNPTTGIFRLESSMHISGEMISVYNLQGRQISFDSSRLSPRKMEINLKGHAPGLYLVRILNGTHHYTGKIIVAGN